MIIVTRMWLDQFITQNDTYHRTGDATGTAGKILCKSG